MDLPINSNYFLALQQFRLKLFILFILFFSSVVFSNDSTHVFTPLSGELPSTLKAESSPYLVEADIFVPPGATVSIENGVVLLFSNFTGLHVQGTLYAKGTPEQRIVFTSKNDTYYNPYASISAAPFDWNGIDIYENAIGTDFENCTVQYSVYGIRSQIKHFKVQSSFFLQNGKSNVSIKDSLLMVNTTPFSYSEITPEDTISSQQQVSLSNDSTDEKVTIDKATSTKSSTRPHNAFKKFLRYTGLTCALGGIGAGIWQYQKFTNSRNKYKNISEKSDYNMQHHVSQDWEKAHDKYKQDAMLLEVFGGVGALGLMAFTISFTF